MKQDSFRRHRLFSIQQNSHQSSKNESLLWQSKLKHKQFDLEAVQLSIKYQPIIYNNQIQLDAIVYLTPKISLINTPLQIQLRGYSHMNFIENKSKQMIKSLQMTDDYLNEKDEKIQGNILVSKQFKLQQQRYQKKTEITDLNDEQPKQGQYFLQGCQVLYQLDQISNQRLEYLQRNKKYQYPINFMLPQKLPISIDNIVLKNIHITIKYTLEIKIVSIDQETNKKYYRIIIIPFIISSPKKQYPFQQLVIQELIRLYHDDGKRKDQFMNQTLSKFIDCFCPHIIYDNYMDYHNYYKTKYKKYDLFHLDLIAVVHHNYHIFLIVRAYQQPQLKSLTVNRDKANQTKKVQIIEEVTQDISLGSMKQTQRKNHGGLGIYKVEVQMIGEIVNICTQSIFKRIILLNQSNYDMVQGEAMVDLQQFMILPQSCVNQLFQLRYSFNIKAYFGDDEGEDAHMHTQMDFFVVESKKTDLSL